MSSADAAFQMRDAEARLVLVHPSLLETAVAAARKTNFPTDRIFQFSESENQTRFGIRDWKFLLGSIEEASEYEWPNLDGQKSKETIATINYSSGTTGLPKGVCISHYNLISNVEQTIFSRNAYKSLSEKELEERWVAFLPLYHAYGQLYTVLMAAKLGVPNYIMQSFRFKEYLQLVQDHKITQLQIAPPIVVMLAKRPETAKYDLNSVIDMTCGAAPLSTDLQNEVSRRLNVKINQGWGMTELTCSAILVPGGLRDE
jgi:acyl-CoA synthetase (AMP-forming)/AMP-acid ligase II